MCVNKGLTRSGPCSRGIILAPVWRKVDREAISEAVEVIQRKEEHVWERNQKKKAAGNGQSLDIFSKAGQHDLLKCKM